MKEYHKDKRFILYHGDALEVLKHLVEKKLSMDCIIASPPYEIGAAYFKGCFENMRKILGKEGTLWLNFNQMHKDVAAPAVRLGLTMGNMIDCGAPYSGVVLDPFMGNGNTGMMAIARGRYFYGVDRNKDKLDAFIKKYGEKTNENP